MNNNLKDKRPPQTVHIYDINTETEKERLVDDLVNSSLPVLASEIESLSQVFEKRRDEFVELAFDDHGRMKVINESQVARIQILQDHMHSINNSVNMLFKAISMIIDDAMGLSYSYSNISSRFVN